MLSPNVGRPSHPVDVPRPIRNTLPVPLPWFSPLGSVFARTYETYASFCIMTRGTSPLLRWAFFRGLAPILFRPADPVVRTRIIAITMNSRSYYASVAPPPKWRLGASYRARRTPRLLLFLLWRLRCRHVVLRYTARQLTSRMAAVDGGDN